MTATQDIWAVVPVKTFAKAKQRLAAKYSGGFRAGLAQAMLRDVLAALGGVQRLAGTLVVTGDPLAADIARQHGAAVISEDAGSGQSAAVTLGARHLARHDCGTMLTMPADLPLASCEEIARLLELHGPGPAFTIVPAHDRRGSNAILCSPPTAVPLAFGDDSFPVHLANARAQGIEPEVAALPGLRLDIDNPGDLERFLRLPSRTHARNFAEAYGLPTPGPARNVVGAAP